MSINKNEFSQSSREVLLQKGLEITTLTGQNVDSLQAAGHRFAFFSGTENPINLGDLKQQPSRLSEVAYIPGPRFSQFVDWSVMHEFMQGYLRLDDVTIELGTIPDYLELLLGSRRFGAQTRQMLLDPMSDSERNIKAQDTNLWSRYDTIYTYTATASKAIVSGDLGRFTTFGQTQAGFPMATIVGYGPSGTGAYTTMSNIYTKRGTGRVAPLVFPKSGSD